MKIMFFDDFRLGLLKGDSVVDVTDVVKDIPHRHPQDLIGGLIARFADYREKLTQAVANNGGTPLAQVKVRPPLPRPATIDCMAVNYMEDGTRSEPAPINAFQKAPSAIIGPGDTMELPDVPASVFEGEAEIAVVIGKRAKNVKAADAISHVFGYVNFIDGSARGLPPPGNVFFQMKSRDTFAPIGPYIVTADEIADPHNLQVKLWVNGTLMQNFNTSDMAHKFRAASSGSVRSTRSSQATFSPPAPTIAASTRFRMATRSNWKPKVSAGCVSMSAIRSSAHGRARHACSARRRASKG